MYTYSSFMMLKRVIWGDSIQNFPVMPYKSLLLLRHFWVTMTYCTVMLLCYRCCLQKKCGLQNIKQRLEGLCKKLDNLCFIISPPFFMAVIFIINFVLTLHALWHVSQHKWKQTCISLFYLTKHLTYLITEALHFMG